MTAGIAAILTFAFGVGLLLSLLVTRRTSIVESSTRKLYHLTTRNAELTNKQTDRRLTIYRHNEDDVSITSSPSELPCSVRDMIRDPFARCTLSYRRRWRPHTSLYGRRCLCHGRCPPTSSSKLMSISCHCTPGSSDSDPEQGHTHRALIRFYWETASVAHADAISCTRRSDRAVAASAFEI
jgi:hypothetical protein